MAPIPTKNKKSVITRSGVIWQLDPGMELPVKGDVLYQRDRDYTARIWPYHTLKVTQIRKPKDEKGGFVLVRLRCVKTA